MVVGRPSEWKKETNHVLRDLLQELPDQPRTDVWASGASSGGTRPQRGGESQGRESTGREEQVRLGGQKWHTMNEVEAARKELSLLCKILTKVSKLPIINAVTLEWPTGGS